MTFFVRKTEGLEKPMIRPGRWGFFERDIATFSALREYDWITNYQKTMSLKAEIFDLEKLQKKTRAASPTKQELLGIAKNWFQELQELRISKIQTAVITSGNKGRNPFLNLAQQSKVNPLGYSLTWPEIESAIKRIDDSKALKIKDREKTLNHIESRLSLLNQELLNLYPKSSRFRQTGAKDSDIRSELLLVWTKVQRQVDAPCGPTGKILASSTIKEQEAYGLFKIDQFIDPTANFRPYER